MFPKFRNPLSSPFVDELTFFREFEGAITPNRGSDGAAGMDFFVPAPKDTADRCFDFMREKCLDAMKDNADESKVINLRFDEFKSMSPDTAFWKAVLLYNKILFHHVLNTPMTSSNPEGILIEPGESITIPTGLSASIPHGYCIQFLNKSGVATKNDLLVGAELVDEDYKGIMHINLHNVGTATRTLKCGQKIVQGVIHRTYWDDMIVNIQEGHITETSGRGEGGFGSTGTTA